MFDSWNWRDKRLTKILHQVVHHSHLLGKIMATQAEEVAILQGVATTLDKVSGETSALLKEVADLQAAASNSDQVSPDLQAAIDAVVSRANAIDALVPDTPAAPAPAPAPAPSGDSSTPTDDGSATTQS